MKSSVEVGLGGESFCYDATGLELAGILWCLLITCLCNMMLAFLMLVLMMLAACADGFSLALVLVLMILVILVVAIWRLVFTMLALMLIML